MKICQLSHVEHSYNFIAPLIAALQAEGHEVVAACNMEYDGEHLRRYLGPDVRCDRVRVARAIDLPALSSDIVRLAAYLRRERFDVVHVHGPLVSMQGRLAARLAGVPVVIYTAHGFYFHDGTPPVARHAHRALERVFARTATDHLVTVNAEDEQAARSWGGTRRGPAGVIRIPGVGVDVDRFHPISSAEEEAARRELRRSLGVRDDDVVITFVGRLVGEKGIAELTAAFEALVARAPNCRLWLVGDVQDSERDQATAEIVRQMLSNDSAHGVARLWGRCIDVRPVLQASDVFALPSYREGMPIALLEAMACGLPVVATEIRGCHEAVEHERSGLLVPPRDARSLRAALRRLVDDPAERAAFGRAGRTRVAACYTVPESLRPQLALYDRLATARRPSTRRTGVGVGRAARVLTMPLASRHRD